MMLLLLLEMGRPSRDGTVCFAHSSMIATATAATVSIDHIISSGCDRKNSS